MGFRRVILVEIPGAAQDVVVRSEGLDPDCISQKTESMSVLIKLHQNVLVDCEGP